MDFLVTMFFVVFFFYVIWGPYVCMRVTESLNQRLHSTTFALRTSLLFLFQSLMFMPGMLGSEGFGMMVPWWFITGNTQVKLVTELTIFSSVFFLFIAIVTAKRSKKKESN